MPLGSSCPRAVQQTVAPIACTAQQLWECGSTCGWTVSLTVQSSPPPHRAAQGCSSHCVSTFVYAVYPPTASVVELKSRSAHLICPSTLSTQVPIVAYASTSRVFLSSMHPTQHNSSTDGPVFGGANVPMPRSSRFACTVPKGDSVNPPMHPPPPLLRPASEVGSTRSPLDGVDIPTYPRPQRRNIAAMKPCGMENVGWHTKCNPQK